MCWTNSAWKTAHSSAKTITEKKNTMDVGWGGVLFVWVAFFWPLIVVTVFTASKSNKIKHKTIFFFVGAMACYTLGILMNFPPGSKLIVEAEKQLRILLGWGEYSSLTIFISIVIMFGVHILITYSIYRCFRITTKD